MAPPVRHAWPARLAGIVRLTHPYPSVLNGLITLALALVAGAEPASAVRLGAAMVALQASIGTVNDLVDVPLDAGRKLHKPIPGGLVGVGEARIVAVAGLVIGLSLAAMSGPVTVGLAVVGVASGYAYDLHLKGSAVSWLPFAVGIPLLPVFAWVGASGRLPGAFALLVPLAALAGAALAIGNARADFERDLDAGSASVATRLGLRRSWQVHAVIHVVVVAAAIWASWLTGNGRSWVPLASAAAGLVILAGVALGRTGGPRQRELAWEVEAAGAGLLAVAWLVGAEGSR